MVLQYIYEHCRGQIRLATGKMYIFSAYSPNNMYFNIFNVP